MVVDTLAKRYGWNYTDISENMYWEQVYEMYEIACNLNVLEKNEDMKFNFILHAQTKDAQNSWNDLPIPYPDKDWNPVEIKESVIPQKLFGKVAISRKKATPAERKRAEEVRKRMREHEEEIKKINDSVLYKKWYK